MKTLLTFIITFFVIHFPSILCASQVSPEFTLFYSNDVRGETEPCG